jgi:uncharacterized integral membrane protein
MPLPEDRERPTTPGPEVDAGAVPPPLPPPAPAAPEAEPPPPEGGPAPASKTEPPPKTEPAPRRERPSLSRDLDEVQRGRPERAFNVGAVVGIVLTVAAAIFVIQNNRTTEFDWLWFDFELPLWTALLGAVAVGVVLVVVLFAVHDRRQRRIGRRRDAAGRLRKALTPREPKAAG